MSENKNIVYIDLEADTSGFEKQLNESVKYARDTGKELDQSLKIKMDLNIAQLQVKLQDAKDLLKKAKEEGDEDSRIKLQVEVNELSRNLTEAKRQLNNYVNTGDSSLSRLQVKFNQVTDEIKKSRDELSKIGKSTTGIDKLIIKSEELQKEFTAGRIDINKYNQELLDLQKQLKDSAGGFEGVIGKIGEFRNFLIGGAIVTGFTQAIDFVGALDQAYIKLGGQLGITGGKLDQFKDSLDILVGTGFIQLNEGVKVITTLNKELGLVGKELEDTAIGVGVISKTFEKDYNEVLRASTALQKNFGLSGKEANDLVIGSLQKTGDTYDDLLDSINEYSAKAKDSGIEVERFISILIEGTNRGIRNTDELADVQREFAIRLQDGSKSSKEALDKLGISFDLLKKQIASGEKTVGQAMREIAQKIQDVEDPIERVQIGTDLLGTKFEDNGEIIISVLADVGDSIGDVTGKTDSLVLATQTGVNSMTTAWGQLSNNLRGTVLPLVDFLAGQVGNIFKLYNSLFTLEEDIKKLNGPTNYSGLKKPITFPEISKEEKVSKLKKDYDQIISDTKHPKLSTEELEIYNNWLKDVTKNYKELTGVDINPKGGSQAITTINSLSDTLNNLQEKLKKEGIGTQAFIDTQKEIKKIQSEIDKVNGKGSGGGGSASKSKVKTEEETQKELEKLRKEAEEKEFKRQATKLEYEAIQRKKSVLESVKSEEEKAFLIEKIDKTLKEDIDLIGKNQVEREAILLKRKVEIQKEYSKTVKDVFDKSEKAVETYQDKLKNIGKIFQALREDAIKSIKDIDYQLSQLNIDTDSKLGERRVSILNREKEIQDELSKFKSEGLDVRLGESIGLSTLKQIGSGTIGDNQKIEDLIKAVELLEEQKKLQQEIALINKTVSDDILKEEQRKSELSQSEKILEEKKTQEAILLERKSILEKIKNDEEINVDEIKDYNNKKLAEDLIEKSNNALEQLNIARDAYKKELSEAQTLDDNKRRIEKEFTNFVKGEITTRTNDLKELQIQADTTAKALERMGVDFSSFNPLNGVNVDALNTASTPKSTTSQVVNITNSPVFHQNINNAVDVNKVNKIVASTIDANSRGMSGLKINS